MTFSRHALRIVKVDPPASDHSRDGFRGRARTTGRAGRTVSLAMLSSLCTTRATVAVRELHVIVLLGVARCPIGSRCPVKLARRFTNWRGNVDRSGGSFQFGSWKKLVIVPQLRWQKDEERSKVADCEVQRGPL